MKRQRFTLIELLFVIMIFIILIGISWVAGVEVLRSQNKSKYKAECVMLESAIERYHVRWGSYPFTGNSSVLNFGEKLSDVAIDTDPNNPSPWGLMRPMYIDYLARGFIINNNDYAKSESEDATATTIFDPYENKYYVEVKAGAVRVFTNEPLLN